MTATEELRRLLDERGVEYETCDEPAMWYTCWRLAGYDMMNACFEEIKGLVPSFYIRNATPEQTVEATLGPGECHDTQEDEERFCCSECGKKSYTVTQYREFDEYGTKTEGWIEVCTPKYCPNCGRKVMDA